MEVGPDGTATIQVPLQTGGDLFRSIEDEDGNTITDRITVENPQ